MKLASFPTRRDARPPRKFSPPVAAERISLKARGEYPGAVLAPLTPRPAPAGMDPGVPSEGHGRNRGVRGQPRARSETPQLPVSPENSGHEREAEPVRREREKGMERRDREKGQGEEIGIRDREKRAG